MPPKRTSKKKVATRKKPVTRARASRMAATESSSDDPDPKSESEAQTGQDEAGTESSGSDQSFSRLAGQAEVSAYETVDELESSDGESDTSVIERRALEGELARVKKVRDKLRKRRRIKELRAEIQSVNKEISDLQNDQLQAEARTSERVMPAAASLAELRKMGDLQAAADGELAGLQSFIGEKPLSSSDEAEEDAWPRRKGNYKVPTEKLNWAKAALQCKTRFNNATLYPLREDWKDKAEGHMTTHGLNTLWVGLKSEVKLQLLNGTFAERSLAPNQIRGPCVIYDDNEIFAVTCDNKREVICSLSSTGSASCSGKQLTWLKANSYCASLGGSLWQDFRPPKGGFQPCASSTVRGFRLGIQVVRKTILLTWRSDIAKEEDCPLKGKEDWTPKCGLLRRDSQDNAVCSLVACTEKHPYLCDERPLATTIEEETELILTTAEHVSEGFQTQIAIWKISIICISIVLFLLIVGTALTIAVRKRRSAKTGRNRRKPVSIQQLKQEQGATMKVFGTASSCPGRDSGQCDSMYEQVDYNTMSGAVRAACGVAGPSQEILGKLQEKNQNVPHAWENRGRGDETEMSYAMKYRYENTEGKMQTSRTEQKNYDGYLQPKGQVSKFGAIGVPLLPPDDKIKRDFIKAFKQSQAEDQSSCKEQNNYDGYLHPLVQSPKSRKLVAKEYRCRHLTAKRNAIFKKTLWKLIMK